MSAEGSMPTPSEPPFSGDVALCRATLYAALALGFRPPSAETLERLTNLDAADALTDAARVIDATTSGFSPDPSGAGQGDGNEGAAGLHTISACAAVLARPEARIETLAAQFRRLFGHTARGEVPPYETEYGNEALFQQPQELSDLAGFMRAFGLVLRREAHERIDHVSCECEFVAFLACKEAYAIDKGDVEMLAATQRATTLFLRDHLGRFAPAFGRRLARADVGGVYGALAALLLVLVESDRRRLGIAVGPENLGLRPDPASCAAPMGCASDGDGGCPAGAA
jgi:TorA maturation chaperone TorD